jgi:hypothetical protein
MSVGFQRAQFFYKVLLAFKILEIIHNAQNDK